MTLSPFADEPKTPAAESRLVSVGLHPPTRLDRRLVTEVALDPYYEIFRSSGRIPSGVDYPTARATAARIGARLPRAYAPERARDMPSLLDSNDRAAALNLLGALVCWGALTSNQAAALVGDVRLADPRSRLVATLFVNELVRINSPLPGQGLADAGRAAAMYQLGYLDAVHAQRHLLTGAEWLAVSGGHDLPSGDGNPRHDVLAAELGLRAAALPSIATVVGPRLSGFSSLVPPLHGCTPPKGGPDLVLVRNDGMRICIELTATTGRAFDKKVERWARLLAEAPMKRTGIVVIFLAAGRLVGMRKKAARWPEHEIYKNLAAAVAKSGSRDVAERMFAAHWHDWFPAPLTATSDFTTLTAAAPVGHRRAWAPASVGDVDLYPFTPEEDVEVCSIVPASAMLGQTPHHIRSRVSIDPNRVAARTLHKEAGRPVVLSTRRSDAAGGRPVATTQGVAGHPHFPARLLGTCHDRRPVAIPSGPGSQRRPETTVNNAPLPHPGSGNLARARAAAVAARRLRAEHLIAVAEGVLSPQDVIEAAAQPANIALRAIALKELYIARAMSPRRWRRVRNLTLAVLGTTVAENKMTIGWLHDPRAGGRRHYAFTDALRERKPPWPGFPWHATDKSR
ncbi:hypothetical protein KUV85_12235 [Nocardioides panacisoli]|uniref:hypothetical protein n=1 Tax=Nocardioides panacisoli TaxID=627624 RepID=UPI001C625382|nr:hypothetical protein [Nocardioides panacisoli]QYJ03101.1 hypothetical protein KUV85_12235 [Nocardioides panacisoli]